ncbi:MAG: hypothetical protein N2Z59_01760 [Alteraurantiacibacter sp.]|nr:hypothetical protein [Alteraurantiacibacter sp.]
MKLETIAVIKTCAVAVRSLAAATPALLLASCGSATDASEDAIADTVEMPANEVMAGTPAPVEDPAALVEEDEASPADAAAAAQSMVEADAPPAAGSSATPAAAPVPGGE